VCTRFTRNHREHSNDTGYQLEFFGDKCGNGHRLSFQTSGVGVASKMLKAAGSLFGGRLHDAGWGADHLKDALRGPAWDKAFEAVIGEMRPKFRQCTRCGQWVCLEVRWNEAHTLCETCASNLGEEVAAAQARRRRRSGPRQGGQGRPRRPRRHEPAADGGVPTRSGSPGQRGPLLRGVRQADRGGRRGQDGLLHRVRRQRAVRLRCCPNYGTASTG
jgi:hypothetical protein